MAKMICTTLNKIRQHSPCHSSYERLLRSLGKTRADDEPLPMLRILDILGLYDAIWAMRSLPEYDREWRLFAVWCARQVQHLLKDPRQIAVIDVAERYANGKATMEELRSAAGSARCVDSADWDDTWSAARSAARSAAWSAAGSTWCAGSAARSAAAQCAEAAARSARAAAKSGQIAELSRIFKGGSK